MHHVAPLQSPPPLPAEPRDAAQRSKSLSLLRSDSCRQHPCKWTFHVSMQKPFYTPGLVIHGPSPAEGVGSVARHSTAEVRAGEVSISVWFCGQRLGLLYDILEKNLWNPTLWLFVLTIRDHRGLPLFLKPPTNVLCNMGWPKGRSSFT